MSNNQNIQTSGARRKSQPRANPYGKPSAMEIYLRMQDKAAAKRRKNPKEKAA